jgi:ribosomal protein L22
MSAPDDPTTPEPEEKVEGTEAEAEPKPARKPRAAKKPAAEKAEPVTEAETDADSEAVAEAEPEAETAPAAETAEEAPKPKPARRSRAKKPEPEAKPKKAPREAPVERAVVRAQARYVRTSARKARLVCDLLRGKDVHEARAILAYSQRSVARDWAKVLESAIANAEHNHELVGDDLRILTASADEGPTLKRFRPRAMGRATRIRKRTSHLTITLTPKE